MKVRTFKKVIAGIASLAMTASAFAGLSISASAATFADQVVDLSKFDSQGTYDSATNTETFKLGVKKWSKLDLKPYIADKGAVVEQVTISYTENMAGGYRTAVGFYDADLANYATNAYQDAAGSAVCYGETGRDNIRRVYYGSAGSSYINGTFGLNETHDVVFNIDLNAKTVSGTIGTQNIGTRAIGDIDSIDTLAIYSWVANTPYSISNLKITTVTADETYYDVKFSVDGVTTAKKIVSGGNVTEVPETDKPGYIFKGWNKDSDTATVYSTADIQAMAISANTTFTAVYEQDTAYIEKIVSCSITGADKMTFGPDPDTAYDNAYSVTIKGELGNLITADNLDERVTDFNVKWDIDGFATENDNEGQYCDSYGAFTVNNAASNDTVFALRNVPMNFYGKMTATITYNGETFTASKYVVALGNTTTSNVIPSGGYPSNFSDYPDALLGYKATVSSDNINGSDLITDNMFIAGSDASRGAELMKDADGTKYFHITKGTTSKSAVYTHKLSLSNAQVIFNQKVRYNSNGGTILFATNAPIWNGKQSFAATLLQNGTKLTLNGNTLMNGEAEAVVNTGVWYDIVISLDPTTSLAWVKVYNQDNSLVGEASGVPFENEGVIPTYYVVSEGNAYTGSIDLAGYRAYYPTADTATYSLTASQDTLSIPKGDTADLVASLKTAEGYDITGAATWTVLEEDMQEGVIITPDATDSHKATVTLAQGAAAGEATVQVSIAGYTKTITLNITSSAESVKFTKSNTSVSIPLDDTATTAEYEAVVIDGEGNDLGRDVAYAVYDKNNTAEYTFPEGITFNNGVLTVEKTALPCTFTIRATGKNTDGNDISKAVKVTVHGLAFDFGTTDDDAVAEGYTPVGADTAYTEVRGYGIKSGTPVAGGSASTEDANADYLEGTFEFDANVTPGKMYTVDITYKGTLTNGYVSSDLAGYTLGTADDFTTASYTIAVPTSVLDLRVSGAVKSVTITKNADRTPRTKPVLHHVGDSTAANNGSWAYHIDHNRSSFPELDALVTFYNNGAGGRNLCTYYTQGKLQGVLNDIYPGDIVMFGNNGTNGMGSSFEADVNYYLDAAEAMGAKIIINSYTPHGAVGDYAGCYDSATNTFNGYRKDSYDVIVRKVAEERAKTDDNYLGFVEIGKNADAAFNAYVADYAKNGYASADAAAQAIIKCFSDHNHYSDGSIARTLMLDGYGDVKGVVEQLVTILTATPKITCDQIIATYENGVVTGVTINRGVEVEDATMSVVTDNGVTTKTMYWTTVEEMEIAK